MRLGNKKKKNHLEFQFVFEASLSPQLQHIETLQEYSQDSILYKENTDITLYVIFVKIFACKNFSRNIKRYLTPSY